LDAVTVVSSSSLKATVPAGFPAGLYDLAVQAPPPPDGDGQTAYLSKAYMAVSPSPGLVSGLRNPNKLATDTAMNLYVADPQGGRVVAFDATGKQKLTIPNLDPLGIAVDRDGRILVGDRRLKNVRVFSRVGLPVTSFGQGQLERPVDVAVDYSSGWVYVADQRRNAVLIFDGQGTLLSGNTTWKDQSGTPVQLNAPTAIAVDGVRNELLVADQNNKRILIFSVPTTSPPKTFVLAATVTGRYGAVRFERVHGVSIDADGRIYISDAYQNLVQVADRAGNRLGVLGGFGEGLGDLRVPSAILLDPYKRIVVADWNNGRVNFYASGALPANSPRPALKGIQPAQGPSGFPLSVAITGTGFMVGASVKLAAEGGGEVQAGSVQVVDGEYLMATFDLTGAPPGTWSLALTNPDRQTATLPRAFLVTAPDFWLTASPSSQTVIPGGRTSFVVTVAPLNGFDGAVDLTLIGAPTGTTLSPARIKPGEIAVADVAVPEDFGFGARTLTIQGSALGLSRQAQVTLNVVEPATLRVHTQPGGARVYLDGNYGYLGRYLGRTEEDQPLVISGLLPGPHVLRLTHPGKREEYLRPVLVSGPNEVRVRLEEGNKDSPEAWTQPVPLIDASGAPLGVPGPSTAFVLDWLNRGRKDLIVGDGEGDVHVFLDVATDAAPQFRNEATAHLVLADAAGKSLRGDRGAAVFAVDWNNDGRQDLLVGDSSGSVRLYLNHGTPEASLYGPPKLLQAGSQGVAPQDIRLPSRFVAPVVVGWDQDGRKDLLVGDEEGKLWLFRNRGTDAAPELNLAESIPLPRQDLAPRAAPFVTFWDEDGKLDLLVGRQDGQVVLYKGRSETGAAVPESSGPLKGERDVPLSFGGGAVPFILDWDGDGRRDIVSGTLSGEILWSRPAREDEKEEAEKSRRPSGQGRKP
jgi:DNA-binding beta-propeller fold protein YncE